MARNHLYLVDGSGYIFRAYHRLPPLTDPEGTPVGAVYGYTAMLWKLADGLDKAVGPTHLAVILDHSGKSFRNAMYAEYKANRPPAPEDLVPQFPLIRDATRAFSLPCIELENYEADDLIATYATAAHAAGWDVTIVSTDKDLMQLMTPDPVSDAPRIDMLDTMKNVRLGPDAVVEKFGVGPERLGDVLALMGDSVDNVPGITGVGPKTAAKLILEHGDLEAVLAAAPAMKAGKLRDNLIEQADQARLSRQLVELAREAPMPQPLDALKLDGIPPEPLRAFLLKHGFRTMAARLDGSAAPSPPPPRAHAMESTVLGASWQPREAATPPARATAAHAPIDRSLYETVTDLAALDRWVSEARAAGTVAIDTETDRLDSVTGGLVGVSLATAPGRACYIPLGHVGADLLSDTPRQLPMTAALDRLRDLCSDAAVLKIGHNLKYDMAVLAQHAVPIAPYDDTLLMSFALDAGAHGHGMDELAELHLGHTCISFKEVCGTGRNQISFASVPLDRATQYAAEDADVTLRLWSLFRDRLWREQATRIYELVDRRLVTAVMQMERRGILVDRAVLARLSGVFAEDMARLEAAIHAEAGTPFTIASPKQLGEILFDRLGLKGGRKGKAGDWSTDQNELERLERDGVPIARMILEWRQVAKLKSTYSDALQQQINPVTGRVHTSYSLVGAQTGRLSSTDPNLQNIPIRSETGRQIRDAFVAAPDHVLISADYSQIELRLAADMANVPQLREAFAEGADIHARTAIELFGEVTRETRARAKTVNFAILYGISRYGLARSLEIKSDEAQAIISRYFERFPGISDYMQATLEQARTRGYTETLFGRKTWFPRINSRNQNERAGSERAAINAPIQGTSADIIKRAMNRMDAALDRAGLAEVRMLLQVHDELVFEAPAALAEAALPIIREVMTTTAAPAVNLSVPLVVEVGMGASWGSAH